MDLPNKPTELQTQDRAEQQTNTSNTGQGKNEGPRLSLNTAPRPMHVGGGPGEAGQGH